MELLGLVFGIRMVGFWIENQNITHGFPWMDCKTPGASEQPASLKKSELWQGSQVTADHGYRRLLALVDKFTVGLLVVTLLM